ncbi:MAG: segregation and condensation protein A [Catonella sp.]|uniref:segregation and condensation protein A n=1 Tax=Catonella sp. TaxID=2382125 RepID=UPI003F9EF81D
MGIEVKLEAFEGPLDLLLHLIEKNKIDIYDIPIAEITDQYMEYVKQMNDADLDTMSDFLLVAAQLINIKSRMLLPVEEKENGEPADPREELVNRLLEYKMHKYSAELLKAREDLASFYVFKEPTIPREVAEYKEKPDMADIIGDLTLAKLHNIFNFVIKKQTDKADPIRSSFGKIKKEPINISDSIKDLQDYGKLHKYFSFKDFLLNQPSRLHVVVSFLAVLELMKVGVIKAVQEVSDSDIAIEFISEKIFTKEDYKNMEEE